MKARIYVDASVVGGCEDSEFAEHSLRLFERCLLGDCVFVVSSLTVQELALAPGAVRQRLASVPEANVETLQLDLEAVELAQESSARGSLARRCSPMLSTSPLRPWLAWMCW